MASMRRAILLINTVWVMSDQDLHRNAQDKAQFEAQEKAREQSFIKSLRSGNRTAILATLKDIRSSGTVTILPEVFDVLMEQEDEQIYNEAVSLINDLKSKESVPYLTDAIADAEFASIRQELVASCWQNGLSYSKHIGLFVKVALNDPYATAIEAFTVIEGCIGDVAENELQQQINYIRQHISSADPEKHLLLHELIKVMESYDKFD